MRRFFSVVGITRNYSEIVGITRMSRKLCWCWPEGRMAVRDCLPTLRACAGRLLPEAAPDCSSVSHADHSTIGSNFCQGPFWKYFFMGGTAAEDELATESAARPAATESGVARRLTQIDADREKKSPASACICVICGHRPFLGTSFISFCGKKSSRNCVILTECSAAGRSCNRKT